MSPAQLRGTALSRKSPPFVPCLGSCDPSPEEADLEPTKLFPSTRRPALLLTASRTSGRASAFSPEFKTLGGLRNVDTRVEEIVTAVYSVLHGVQRVPSDPAQFVFSPQFVLTRSIV